jgi:SnoaL-like domain
MTTLRSSATDPGVALVEALVERDFDGLAATLAPDVDMRALIPPGPVEVSGAEAAAAKYASWFGRFDEVRLVRSDIYNVGDRLHVSYRLRAKEPDDLWKIVEQHLFCALGEGRITTLDLLCSGFRPDQGQDGSMLASAGF